MSNPSPSQFLEFSPEQFPIRMEAYTTDGTVVWSVEADVPGGVSVPSLRQEHGPIGVRVYCNGVLNSDTAPPTPEYLAELDARAGRSEWDGWNT